MVRTFKIIKVYCPKLTTHGQFCDKERSFLPRSSRGQGYGPFNERRELRDFIKKFSSFDFRQKDEWVKEIRNKRRIFNSKKKGCDPGSNPGRGVNRLGLQPLRNQWFQVWGIQLPIKIAERTNTKSYSSGTSQRELFIYDYKERFINNVDVHYLWFIQR